MWPVFSLDHVVVQVISAASDGWIRPFTGLSVREFRKLVGIVRARGAEQTGAGRRWGLGLEDRVLLVAVYYRTNLTLRQVALLFGISKSATGRVVDHLAPYLVLCPVRRRRGPEQVLIVDGTLVPTHDRSIAASSKNYRYSTNLQVVIDADSRLTVAVGKPVPGNRNDCRAFADSGADAACAQMAVMGDGGYQGTRVITPFRKPAGATLPEWKEQINTRHRRIRARAEHALAGMKNWNILRNCRRKRQGVYYATSGIALMRNLTLTTD
ncbi:hypothetical protein GCM10023317_40320 [Actinopolymorpha pittospori]|nr:transposase [Actinopolymorpha pittospori]